jgi:hypothetical protein
MIYRNGEDQTCRCLGSSGSVPDWRHDDHTEAAPLLNLEDHHSYKNDYSRFLAIEKAAVSN